MIRVRPALNVAVISGWMLLSLSAFDASEAADKKADNKTPKSDKPAKAPRAPRAPRPQVARETKRPVQQRATRPPEPQRVTDHHLSHAHLALLSVRRTLRENADRAEARIVAMDRERSALKSAHDAERASPQRDREKLARIDREYAANERVLSERVTWTKREIARTLEIDRSLERREKTLVETLRFRRFKTPTAVARYLSPYEMLASVVAIERSAAVLGNTDRDYGGTRPQAIADLKEAALDIQKTSNLRLYQGIQILETVKTTLESAGHEFGGHRAKTLAAVQEADRNLRKAIESMGETPAASVASGESLSIAALTASSGILDSVVAFLRKSENDFGGFRDPSVGALRDVSQNLTLAVKFATPN
jgi:hypothetical protein